MRNGYALAVACGLVVCGLAWAGPSLVLEPATFDWGRQTENKGEYKYAFTVKNAGDEELQITRVRPGCSCTKVELKKQTLAPGESTEMTGGLTTRGVEGPMQKGIILTSNDPVHQTTVANLAIRFPMSGQGLRLKGTACSARLRQDALWAYPVVENCESDKPIQIQAMELPDGWDSPQTLPVTVPAEERVTVVLKRPVGVPGVEPEGFDGLPFTLVTDSPKTPRLQGTLVYRPETRATTVSAPAGASAAGTGTSPVRWPMTKPAPRVAPITEAPAAPPQAPAPPTEAQAANGVAPAAQAAPAPAPVATPAQ